MDSNGGMMLGIQRESLNNNPLLIRSELGRPLRRCFTLPPEDFVYGKRSFGNETGAADALSSWKPSNQKFPNRNASARTRDFISLNKAATQAGLVTAQEHSQYRATHDVKRKPSAKEQNMKLPKRLPPTMVFGVPTQRTATPVFDLLEHRYQSKWLNERKQAELNSRKNNETQTRSGSGKGYYETRASMMRRHSPPVDPPPLWQMRRFKKIPGQLETFRSDGARGKAFSHHATDCTSRTGVFGHGIYEGAKN
ncbi:cilia- and flagella-associated protein 77-like [Rhopilema esculentum]|uniref:cilia- and flagella-associated protein 77-like n=1 Tax=Rhopilema esculentum TaxID=499914 RepID=UPI0031D9E6F8